MANEKRLIDANDAEQVKKALAMCYKQGITSECAGCVYKGYNGVCMDALMEDALALINSLESCIDAQTTVDAVEVVPGRWEKCGGDLHSSGYAIYCSVCNKTHFVHYKYSLGGLYGCKELFEKPKYCPSCGAFMEIEE